MTSNEYVLSCNEYEIIKKALYFITTTTNNFHPKLDVERILNRMVLNEIKVKD